MQSSSNASSNSLSRQTDYIWRIAELLVIVAGFGLWLAQVDIVPGLLVALLAGSWGARFIWAANNMNVLEGGRMVSKVERLTSRGAQLSLTVTLYLCLLEGSVLPVFFLFGAMSLILAERVWFMVQRIRDDNGAQAGS